MSEYPKKFEPGELLLAEEMNKFVDIYNTYSTYNPTAFESRQREADIYYLNVRDFDSYIDGPYDPATAPYRPEKPLPHTVMVIGPIYSENYYYTQGVQYQVGVSIGDYVRGPMVARDDQPYPNGTVIAKNGIAAYAFEPVYAAVNEVNDDDNVDSSKPRQQYGVEKYRNKLKRGRGGFIPLGLSDSEFKNQVSGQVYAIQKVVQEYEYPRYVSFQNAQYAILNDGEYHLLSLIYYNAFYGYNYYASQMEIGTALGFGNYPVSKPSVAGKYQYNINIDSIFQDYYYYYDYYTYPFQDAYLILQPIKCKVSDGNWQPIGLPLTVPLTSNYYYYGGLGYYYGYGQFNTSLAFNGVVDLAIDEFFAVLVKSNIPLRYGGGPTYTQTYLYYVNARIVACG